MKVKWYRLTPVPGMRAWGARHGHTTFVVAHDLAIDIYTASYRRPGDRRVTYLDDVFFELAAAQDAVVEAHMRSTQ